MSIEALEQFRAKLATDAVLQKACLAAMSSGKQADVLAEGRKLGLEFTEAEIQQTMGDAELSEFELELVSAGSAVDCGNNGGTQK